MAQQEEKASLWLETECQLRETFHQMLQEFKAHQQEQATEKQQAASTERALREQLEKLKIEKQNEEKANQEMFAAVRGLKKAEKSQAAELKMQDKTLKSQEKELEQYDRLHSSHSQCLLNNRSTWAREKPLNECTHRPRQV